MSRSHVVPRPLTGRRVLLMMIRFFGVVFAVNGVMMKLAIQTLPGTEVDSAYSASLAYENEIAAAHDQNERNWKVDAHIQREADGGTRLRVEVHDNDGLSLAGLRAIPGHDSNAPLTVGPISRLHWPKSKAESLSATPHRSRLDNGIWCSKAMRRGGGCFYRKIECC